MSYLKRMSVCFLSLALMTVIGCTKEELLLETGENIVQETTGLTEAATETRLQNEESKALIYVYVCGQVKSPGVYKLSTGDRIYQAIEMAGGVLSEGNLQGLNLASVLSDGQKVYVPSYDEAASGTMNESDRTDGIAGTDSGSDGFYGDLNADTGHVNINTASKEQLMTLPGIGLSKAEAILKYRQEYGSFKSIEELMEVSGIKEGTYSKIKDRIAIN